MPGVIFGYLIDLKPVIPCVLANPITQSRLPVRALVDTGATDIVIRPEHVAQLGLMEAGPPRLNHGVGFSGLVRHFAVEAILTGRMLGHLERDFVFTISDARALEGTQGPPEDYDVLLGMNCLAQMDVRFTPNGWFELRFG